MTNQKQNNTNAPKLELPEREMPGVAKTLDTTQSINYGQSQDNQAVSASMVQYAPSKSRANFICFNTANLRGTRINLDDVESYAPNTDTSIQLGRKSGRISLDFTTKEERDEVLARLDSYCL